MNTKLIIVIIVIVTVTLLLAIGGYYYWNAQNTVSAESESVPVSSSQYSSSPRTETNSVAPSTAPSTAPSSQSNTSTNSIPLSASTTSAQQSQPSSLLSSPTVAAPAVIPSKPTPTAPISAAPATAVYATTNGTKYTKSTSPSCVTTTGNGTFLTNTNGEWIGMPLDQAIDTCAKTSNLGGHGKCLGIMPTGMTAQPWTGCLSVDNREGRMAYLLTN